MRDDPHLLMEGCFLASFAIRARTAFIYIRGEYIRVRERLEAALAEGYDAKLIGKDNVHGWDFDLVVQHGAGFHMAAEGAESPPPGALRLFTACPT